MQDEELTLEQKRAIAKARARRRRMEGQKPIVVDDLGITADDPNRFSVANVNPVEPPEQSMADRVRGDQTTATPDAFQWATKTARNIAGDFVEDPLTAAVNYSGLPEIQQTLSSTMSATGNALQGDMAGARFNANRAATAAPWAALDATGLGIGGKVGKNSLRTAREGVEALPDVRMPESLRGRSEAPTMEALVASRDSAYKSLDDLGVRYTDEAYLDLVHRMGNRLTDQTIDQSLHPRASRMYKILEDRVGVAPTLRELDQLRQVISRDVASATDAGEKRMGSIMIEEIDDFIASATPRMTSAGDGQVASQAIKNARNLHSRVKKAELIEEAILKAQDRAASTGSGGNVENAIRQNLRQILDNPKKRRGFSEDEIKAMREIVRGTPTQNALRGFGKMSPVGSGLNSTIWTVGGSASALSNPVTAPFAIGLPIAAAVSKNVADKGVQNQTTKLLEMIRRGGVKTDPIPGNLDGPSGNGLLSLLGDETGAVGDLSKLPRKNALDMSTDARIARAKEQGFDTDTVMYHGTDADFEDFKSSYGGTFGPGVYLSENSNVANQYAADIEGGNVLPLVVRGRIANTSDFPGTGYGDGADKARQAQEQGFAGIRHNYNPSDSEVVIFDPKNIRSKFARFDPANANDRLISGFSTAEPLSTMLGGSGGAVAGMNSDIDVNGDGEIDWRDKAIAAGTGFAVGAGAGYGAGRGLRGKRVAAASQANDYSFTTSSGNRVETIISAPKETPGSINIDFNLNGGRMGSRPNDLPPQTPREVGEIMSGVEKTLRDYVAKNSPNEIIITPRDDRLKRIYERVISRTDLDGYTAQTRKSEWGWPEIVLKKDPIPGNLDGPESGFVGIEPATTIAGGAAGYIGAQDINGDGKVSQWERAAFAAGGAGAGYGAGRGLQRGVDRVRGSGRLPKNTEISRDGYIMDSTPQKPLVSFSGSSTSGSSTKDNRLDALNDDIHEVYSSKRSLSENFGDRDFEFFGSNVSELAQDKQNLLGNLAQGASRSESGMKKTNDQTEVAMNFLNNQKAPKREIHKSFEDTFLALEDHAIRYREPYYSFSGLGQGHDRYYARALRKNGPPRGYVGVIVRSRSNPDQKAEFGLFREDAFRKWKNNRDLSEVDVEVIKTPPPKKKPPN